MSEAAALRALYEAKARAELSDADEAADVGPGGWRGDVMAAVALVVGAPDVATGELLPEAAGEAIAKALAALGFEAGSEFVIASRPSSTLGDEQVARRLRLSIEAVDPPLVLALDAVAAKDLVAAFGLTDLPLGAPASAFGRTLGYVGEFAASLGDDRAKARAWGAMKAVTRSGAATPARRPKAPRETTDTLGEER